MSATMHIPEDIGLWLQETLHEYDGERWGMADFVLGNLDSIPRYTAARWQLGVDTVYRAVTCDLVKADRFGGFPDVRSFFHAARTLSPDGKLDAVLWTGKFNVSGPGFWNGTTVRGTERLRKLFAAYFPSPDGYDGKLNPAFIEALEQIFAENGVPWSDKPLLPVMPAVAGGAAGGAAR
jgi:hypothetical protein